MKINKRIKGFFNAIKSYCLTLFNAVINKKQTYKERPDIGSQAYLTNLKKLYPIKLYKKGITLEELAGNAGEQKVLNTIEQQTKRKTNVLC